MRHCPASVEKRGSELRRTIVVRIEQHEYARRILAIPNRLDHCPLELAFLHHLVPLDPERPRDGDEKVQLPQEYGNGADFRVSLDDGDERHVRQPPPGFGQEDQRGSPRSWTQIRPDSVRHYGAAHLASTVAP